MAHFSDIETKNIDVMREGNSVYERCGAISNMCNSSRVWTAMEYTQSRNLQVMLQDYSCDSLVQKHGVHRPFVQELGYLWYDKINKQGNAQTVEQMVGMVSNLVPWQLGPLELCQNAEFPRHSNDFWSCSRVTCAEMHHNISRFFSCYPHNTEIRLDRTALIT